jgi:hypothetical protein
MYAAFKAKGGIARADIDRGVALLKKNDTCFIHYVIKDNTIYTKGYGKYQVWGGSYPRTGILSGPSM